MTSITVPDYGRRGRKWWPIGVGVLAVLLSSIFAANWFLKRGPIVGVAGTYFTVTPMDLVISIHKDGDLQALKNVDIICEVEGQTRIQTIVKEGTYVKKGETMVTMDSADITRKLADAKVQLQKCDSDLTTAKEEKSIQDEKNTADYQASVVELKLAKLDLAEYMDGKYPQSQRDDKRQVEMAEITLKNKQEENEQIQKLYDQGFVTAADKKNSELDVLKAQNDLDKNQTELDVLTKYTRDKESTDRQSKVEQAERKLVRTQHENISSAKQKVAAVEAAEEAAKIQKYLVEHMDKQLAACTIKAPSDGLVVYGTTGQQWYYRDRPIQAGAQVNERELLIRLPDTSKMKAMVKVPESWISKLKMDDKHPIYAMVDIVGVPKPVRAKMTSVSVMADNSQSWWNPDAKDYPVELTLDQTPPALKPGTSVKAEIDVEKIPQTIAIPMNAIYAVGADRYVFVKDLLHGVSPEKVILGQSSDTHVQVTQGLSPGQDVLLLQVGQGRELLEKAGIKTTAAPTTQAAPTEPPARVAAAR
ncbi:MAG TPA: HlyD family efflux transporter periplasmic adaptor subunit [Tepidisphaeraceae bacterium]|jgi:multidrug resistance efflux pump|nr:HlyD family efflux transporter periplasmic adaptor subunit [Tepidisphaeraceae bacterium]